MSEITIGEPTPTSPHNQAVYEAGKQILIDSVSVGREFCKFMVGVATGAIPLFVALVQLALPKSYRPDLWKGVVGMMPAVGFLIAATAFAIGVFPRTAEVALDSVTEIEAARRAAIRRRARIAGVGFSVFMASVLGAVVVALAALRVNAPAPAVKPTEVRLFVSCHAEAPAGPLRPRDGRSTRRRHPHRCSSRVGRG